MKVYPYKMYSNGAKELARSLNIKRVWPKKWKPKHDDLIINWGSSKIPALWAKLPYINDPGLWLNFPGNVKISCSKAHTLVALDWNDVNHPQYTMDKEVVAEWLEQGLTVIARTLLSSHSGKGIIILNQGDAIVNALLYTVYEKKKHEYRVHVFDGEVIDVQQKKKRKDYENHNNLIRNHGNGWVYCRENISVPIPVLEQSVNAIKAVGLDFGAVDIGWNEHYQRATVYEVNSAPGLYGSTIAIYQNAIIKFVLGV